jgi:hypothetical protein
MDNLNVHCEGALYRTFPPEEARRILRRLKFNFTPRNAEGATIKWLFTVEDARRKLARHYPEPVLDNPIVQ